MIRSQLKAAHDALLNSVRIRIEDHDAIQREEGVLLFSVHKEAEEEIRRLKEEAAAEAQRTKDEALEEARRLKEEAHANASELLEKSRRTVLRKAQDDAERMILEAEAKVRQLEEDAKVKVDAIAEALQKELLERARQQADRYLEEARAEAEKIKERAHQASETALPVRRKAVPTPTEVKELRPSQSFMPESLADLFRSFVEIVALLEKLATQRPEYHGLIGRLRGSSTIYDFIANREEADRVVALNLTEDVLRVIRMVIKDVNIPEPLMLACRKAVPVCRKVQETFSLNQLPNAPEPRRVNIRGRILLMFAEYLRPRTEIVQKRFAEESAPGLVSDNVISIMATAVGRMTAPEKNMELDQMSNEITSIFRLSRQTRIEWDQLFASSIAANFSEYQRAVLIENKQLRETLVQFIIRNHHKFCTEKVDSAEATRCGKAATCEKHATVRDACLVEREAKLLLETLLMPLTDWNKLALTVHGVTRVCLPPEHVNLLDQTGNPLSAPAFLLRNHVRYLSAQGVDKGWPALLKKSLTSEDVTKINELLSGLSPRLREIGVLQLMHREILNVELLEQVLLKRYAKQHRERMMHEMPGVVAELTGRFRWLVYRAFRVEQKLVVNRPEIRFAMEILRLKNLLLKLGFNQVPEGERHGLLDNIQAAPALLEAFFKATLRIWEEEGEEVEYHGSQRKKGEYWERDESAVESFASLKAIGFEAEARFLASRARQFAA
ncbi:MAG: hypothetical protein HQL51_08215 [Magnetococcales bacterium]|nr:hypothetical protein [Magnetococcales bacterium]